MVFEKTVQLTWVAVGFDGKYVFFNLRVPIYPKKRFKKHVCLVTRKGFRLEGTTATKKKGKENQPTCKTFKTFKTLGFQTFWSLIYNIIVNSNMGIRLLDFSDFCFFLHLVPPIFPAAGQGKCMLQLFSKGKVL